MSAQFRGEPFPQADFIVSTPHIKVLSDSLSEMPLEGLREEWQVRLQTLQGWICELLIKNQQLRMALREMERHRTGN